MIDSRPDSHGRFIWYELMTTDMKAAKAFYSEVVGWGARDASMPDMPYILFTAGGTPVCGMMALPKDAIASGFRPTWLGYVGVDDVDATADRIVKLGGAVHVPPKDIPDVSRLSVAVDPQMATIALLKWLDDRAPSAKAASAAEPATPNCVGWHELLAADWEKAWAFYGELFGWQKADTEFGANDAYQAFSAGGQTIGGMCTKPPAAPVPFWLYYFNVGDIDLAAKRVKASGGTILNGPFDVPEGGWIVQCADPQGAIFGLQGRRKQSEIGYFERVTSRETADARFVWRK